MKREVSAFVKHALSAVSEAVKSKRNALKDKASDVMKSKVVVLGLLKNKKVLRAIWNKMNAVFHSRGENMNMALTVYQPCCSEEKYERELDNLRLTLFDSEDKPRNSVSSLMDNRISMTMDPKQLEEEIDNVADIFITRFHAQMRMQKSDSFKLYEEMLDRSV